MRNNTLTKTEIKKLQLFGLQLVALVVIIFFFFPFSLFIIFFAHKAIKDYFTKQWEKTGLHTKMLEYKKQLASQNQSQENKNERVSTSSQQETYESSQDRLHKKIESNSQLEKQEETEKKYELNRSILQDKLSQESRKKKKIEKDKTPAVQVTNHSLNSSKNTHKNFFGNSHKSKLFGENKSIWDDYESVTDKFSSKNK